jgi:RNA polymerase sigma-70 factor (ECF subfamily)
MTDRTDKKLATGVRKGRPESFDALYELYKLPIFNFLYQMVGDVEEAKDLTQESFVAMYQVLLENRKIDNLKAYLYTVARNKALLQLQRRSKEYADDDLLQQVPDDSYYADPVRAARNRKQQVDIVKALQMMPERYREVLALREQAGFSYDHIAEMLDTNKTNVGVMIYRARAKFREMYRMLQLTEIPDSDECERILPLISCWLDGETTSKQEKEIQGHINECPFCTLASEQMVEANTTFHSLIPLLLPLTVKAGVMAKAGLAGAIPTSIAAGVAGGAGAGTSVAGASSASLLGGAAAGSGTAASGAGAGAGAGVGVAATGLSAKAVGIAAAAIVAAAAVSGGAYVGIREAYRKPVETVQSVQHQINEFVKGRRASVEIPDSLRKRAGDVMGAAQEFIKDKMPNYTYEDIAKAAETGVASTMSVSGLKPVGSAPEAAESLDCYLQVVKDKGSYQVQKMTRELNP